MASSSSSPHSSSSKSSQPLHNFELPPLLKWHSKDGKSAGTQKRYRTVKSAASPPPPQADPLLHLVAAAALFEADLMPPPREPVGGEAAAALDDEFERMSLLRDESLRNYRGRDWRSEADQSPVISYRRKSASSSSSAKNRHSSSKTSISPSPASAAAGEDSRRKSPLNKSAFAAPPAPTLLNYFDSENRGKSENPAAVEIDSYRKSISDSYSEERRSDAFSFKKSEFSSSSSSSAWKKHDWFNKSSPAEDADSFQKSPFYKKFEFVSRSKPDFPSNSEVSVKIEAAEEADASNPKQSKKSAHASQTKQDANSKIEKLSMVAASNHLKKSALPSQAKSDDKMKSKVVEDSHLPPKKKPSFALASSINKEADASPKIPLLKPKLEQSDTAEKKATIKIKPKEVKQEVENPKKDTDLTGDDAEATRVWNLRPRIPKGKAVTQLQKKSGGASKSAAEKMKKLSISVSLTKEEIEEDIFALTGAKPARRPKRRPRNVQRQLDAVFPGLWLVSISKDTYKVSEKK